MGMYREITQAGVQTIISETKGRTTSAEKAISSYGKADYLKEEKE